MAVTGAPNYKVVAYWDGLPLSLSQLKKIAPGLAREYRQRRKLRQILAEKAKRVSANQEYAAAARVITPQQTSFFSRLRSLISRRRRER